MMPAAFMAAMIVGGVMGYSGITLPMVEQGIALSVIVMGVLIAIGQRMPAIAAMALVAAFAALHGHAHGSEGTEAASFSSYALGFAAATFLLHVTGLAAGVGLSALEHKRALLLRRIGGGAGVMAGIAFLAG
jgi:urease accessory protein